MGSSTLILFYCKALRARPFTSQVPLISSSSGWTPHSEVTLLAGLVEGGSVAKHREHRLALTSFCSFINSLVIISGFGRESWDLHKNSSHEVIFWTWLALGNTLYLFTPGLSEGLFLGAKFPKIVNHILQIQFTLVFGCLVYASNRSLETMCCWGQWTLTAPWDHSKQSPVRFIQSSRTCHRTNHWMVFA